MPTNVTPTVNLDELTPIGAFVPPGRYTAALQSVEGKKSKNDNPMVVAEFVVNGGDQEGNSITIWYPLVVTEKNGKKYAGGIMDLKRTFAAIGKPLATNFAFPLDANLAAKAYGTKLKGVSVEIAVLKEMDRLDPTKERTRAQVVGLAKGASQATAADGDAAADFNFGD